MKTPSNFIPMEGTTWGKLTVLRREGKTFDGKATWVCACQCGNQVVLSGKNIRNGNNKSCGCLKAETMLSIRQDRVTHGHAGKKKSPQYQSWGCMIARCTNQNNTGYADYGGRGIKVCDRWLSFENFLEDMGDRPEGTSLDRIDNNGNYEPGNCRWVSSEIQARNHRRNINLTFNGITRTLVDWAKEIGISAPALKRRLKLWDIKTALTTPPLAQGQRVA